MGCAYQDRIAIDMEKSRHQIAAVLGVLMIGAIYVPIDTNQPHNRKRKIFEDSNVKCVILNHMADDEKNIVPVIDVTRLHFSVCVVSDNQKSGIGGNTNDEYSGRRN